MSKSSQRKLDRSPADPQVAVEDHVQDQAAEPQQVAESATKTVSPVNEAGVPAVAIPWIRRDVKKGEIAVRITIGVDANGDDITLEFMGRTQAEPMFPSRQAFLSFLEDLSVSGKCQIELSSGRAEREDWFPRLTRTDAEGNETRYMPTIIPTGEARDHWTRIMSYDWKPVHELIQNQQSSGFGN